MSDKIYYKVKLLAWKLIWKFPKLAIKMNVSPHIYYPKKYMSKPLYH